MVPITMGKSIERLLLPLTEMITLKKYSTFMTAQFRMDGDTAGTLSLTVSHWILLFGSKTSPVTVDNLNFRWSDLPPVLNVCV